MEHKHRHWEKNREAEREMSGEKRGVMENKRKKHTGKREKSIWSGHQLPATIKFEEEGESLGYSDGGLASAKFPRETK